MDLLTLPRRERSADNSDNHRFTFSVQPPLSNSAALDVTNFTIGLDKRGCRHQGKVQEEELDSCRTRRRARAGSGMRVQGETQAGSPCAILGWVKYGRAAGSPPLWSMRLGRSLGLGDWLRLLLRLRFGSELLLYLKRDGVRIHFVGLCGGAEDFAAIRLRPRG
jgi:hypothetical protein